MGGREARRAARAARGLPDEPFVGRLDREQGIHVVLQAWRRHGGWQDGGRPGVVGSAPTDPVPAAYGAELRALADGHVVFLPARRDVVAPLPAADVVAVPSAVEEAFGRSVVEAPATGRPGRFEEAFTSDRTVDGVEAALRSAC